MAKAAEAGAAAADEIADALYPAKAAYQLVQRHLRFHAGERIAGAGVDAAAERQVAIGMAADVEPIRIGELRRVAVGGADAQMHVGMRGDLGAADRGVAGRPPIAELVGTLQPQKF